MEYNITTIIQAVFALIAAVVWLKGIYARSLDKENPGKFTAFIDKLRK